MKTLNVAELVIDVELKPIKHTHLSVYPPKGRVLITSPEETSPQVLRLLVIKNLEWIRRQQARFMSQERAPAREYVERESHMLWGRRYLLTVSEAAKPSIVVSGRALRLNAPTEFDFAARQRMFAAWYRGELRTRATPVVAKWAERLDVSPPRLFIQHMKTKWGSSSPARAAIRLNLELAKFTPDCLDYVVLHELAHFKVPDHSWKFRSLLDRYMTGWESVRDRLNAQVLDIPSRVRRR
jgi:predicted metal-dependent hydrolase